MKRHRTVSSAALCLAALLPVLVWLLFEPIRVLAPQLNGMSCAGSVCVESISDVGLAQRLYAEAMANIAEKLTPLTAPPRAVFCSTLSCYKSFGGGLDRGITVFNLGVVIPPQSWQVYIVEHELIHMLQAQELGLRGRERTPLWFKEGMPFSVSAPAASDLPEYARPLVSEYEAWQARVGRDRVWEEAQNL